MADSLVEIKGEHDLNDLTAYQRGWRARDIIPSGHE
jgi:hypothetical protein